MGAMVTGLGQSADDFIERIRAGVLARFPSFAPVDALAYKGSERVMDQGPAESNQAYAERLRTAWDAYQFSGSHGALLRQLAIFGFTGAYIVQDNGWWTTLAKTPPDFTVRLAFTVSISSWAFDGTHLTAPSNGATNADGVAVALNDLVFVPLNAAVSDGVYRCSQAGDVSHPTILTRATGWTTGLSLPRGTAVLVTSGATMANNQFATRSTFTVGSITPFFYFGLLSGGVIFGATNANIERGQPGWFFDVRDDLWSRFMIVFPVHFGPSDAQVQSINAMTTRWRPAYADYLGFVEMNSGDLWGWPPDRAWGGGGSWGATSTFYPPPP
jgi:hypothetical protein